mmetsp:Transcript_13572/g.36321  ORF Transcript_13572/g.36321 Transcript_13572/m.36321 type:complete len:89 (-) Transcript_13572:807-1073(-)
MDAPVKPGLARLLQITGAPMLIGQDHKLYIVPRAVAGRAVMHSSMPTSLLPTAASLIRARAQAVHASCGRMVGVLVSVCKMVVPTPWM